MDSPASPPRPSGRPPSVAARRSELLERAVHDLKNPLAVVRASLEWLEVELEGREDALDAVRDAATASARLLTIVDDLEALATLEAGTATLTARTDLSTIVGALTASAGARLEVRGLTLVSSAPATMQMHGDARLLARALEALVDVAARGVPSGASIELVARIDPPADAVEIEVGVAGTLANGEPLEGLDVVASGGLGIYIALHVANAHRGSLQIVPTATVPRFLVRVPR
jgi:two-component system OmpR family sensor kinase